MACHEVFELEEVPGPDGVLHLLAQLQELVAVELMLWTEVSNKNNEREGGNCHTKHCFHLIHFAT